MIARGAANHLAVEGTVVGGKGEGGKFVSLPWAMQQFQEKVGLSPYPGTLNLRVGAETAAQVRERAREGPWRLSIDPPEGTAWCSGLILPAIIEESCRAYVVLPEVENYYTEVLEFVSSRALREHLSLHDGSPVNVRIGSQRVSPGRIQGLVLDMDGTLINTFDAFFKAIYATLVANKRPGHQAQEEEEEVALLLDGGCGLIEILMKISPGESWDDAGVVEAYTASVRREFRGSGAADVRRIPRVLEALGLLKQSGRVKKIALATGSTAPRAVIDSDLERFGLASFFDCITTGTETKLHKPHPELIRTALGKMGLQPGSCIVVGDASMDIEAGRKAGCVTAGVLTGVGRRDRLEAAGADMLEADLYALVERLILEGWI